MFLKVTGSAYSAMHVGRSSQDILSTLRTAIYRDGAIAVSQTLCDVIGQLLELARMHRDTILPSYTNGVAAQPTSLGHTLLAFSASLIRGLRALQNAISECKQLSTKVESFIVAAEAVGQHQGLFTPAPGLSADSPDLADSDLH